MLGALPAAKGMEDGSEGFAKFSLPIEDSAGIAGIGGIVGIDDVADAPAFAPVRPTPFEEMAGAVGDAPAIDAAAASMDIEGPGDSKPLLI